MYPRYEREEWCYSPVHWYWNGSHWNCIGRSFNNWSSADWDNVADQAYRAVVLKDYGPNPLVIDIEDAAEQNTNFRSALWTGNHLQVTLMSLRVGEEIGLENHANTDQFLRIEEGRGLVTMGSSPDNLTIQRNVREDDAIIVPAGTWHNLINTGNKPLKLYSIYSPPEHPFGTVQQTRAAAMPTGHDG